MTIYRSRIWPPKNIGFAAPAEIGAVSPHAVENNGQATRDGNDGPPHAARRCATFIPRPSTPLVAPEESEVAEAIPASAIDLDSLAYVTYTYGSTGEPKAVEVTHANLAALIDWHRDAFALGAGTRTTDVSSTAMSSGSVGTLRSHSTLPASSTTHTDPRNAPSLTLLPSMHEVRSTPIQASYVKGLQAHYPPGEMQPRRYTIFCRSPKVA
jgi:acyl-CoA synthetase (AMP-forming)/AMP-acid ligase II